jgi:hypothetical protein
MVEMVLFEENGRAICQLDFVDRSIGIQSSR